MYDVVFWADEVMLREDLRARATLLQRGDASRGSSTESARATLLQRGDASTESAAER